MRTYETIIINIMWPNAYRPNNMYTMGQDNMNNTIRTLGWSSHSEYETQPEGFYSTDPSAIDYLLQHETFNHNIWECACGNGNLSKRLIRHGYNVKSTDKYYRGYGEREHRLSKIP